MLVSMLGILKAGGAYVPLDPAFPKDRLAFLLQDTQPRVLLTQQPLLDNLPEHSIKTLCIDRDWPEIARESEENPPPLAKPDDLCYIIFTSGSTGTPKGVVLQHRAVVNTLDWVNKTLRVGPSDRVLYVTSQCFDLSVYDIFGTLAAGGSIRVAEPAELKNPEKLLEILCEEGITIWDSAPPQFQQLVPFLPQFQERGRAKSKLRLVMLSGDWIPVAMPDQIRSTFPKAEVVSLGGATEAAIWSNFYRIGKVEPGWPSIPYGKPIQNSRYHILDAHLHPLPVGVAGELHIGGDCLAAGYHNRPELTRERFIPDPFTGGSERLYKTGDLARYMPDGNIEFLGRIDFQVKVRGYRIELGEIEATLAKHPAIRECVVTARPDASGVKVLVAYAVPQLGQSVDREQLRLFLRDRLPDYMVPAHFVQLNALPLNANGKLDRKALPAPETSSAAAERVIVEPRYDVELGLRNIWEDVLKVKPISVTENFFDLGGHSLQAAVLTARIKSQIGTAIPLGMVFAAPTIEKMALALREKLEFTTSGSIVPMQEKGTWPPLFMVSGIGGHVFTFLKLSKLLGNDYPIYGIKAIGVDGKQRSPDTIEESARQYVKEIVALRPVGPYLLGGYSYGGLVALEIAIQLQALGKQVDLVWVGDINAPGYPRPLPVWRRGLIHAKTFALLPWKEKAEYIKGRWDNVLARILRKLGLGAALAPDVPGEKPAERKTLLRRIRDTMEKPEDGKEGFDQEMVIKRVWASLNNAMLRYMPQKQFDGKITLFRAEIEPEWAATVFDDPLKGWGRWCTRGVDSFVFPGDHDQLMRDENIGKVAEKLREVIHRATRPAAQAAAPRPVAIG
jgi:amino acid adenylation domain-containing protein